jgi:hypothetical protein
MDFIFIKKDSLPHTLCSTIISIFESNKQNEYTIDYSSKEWETIYNYLYYEINICVNHYIHKLNETIFPKQYTFFNTQYFLINNFCIKKYTECTINSTKKNTVTTNLKHQTSDKMIFIWVLNEVENELHFLKNIKIKTNVGQLFIFPCFWSFPFDDINKLDTKYFIIGQIESEHD